MTHGKKTHSKKPMLAKVHIAKKELGLDDGTYRDVLRRVTGKTSAADLSKEKLEAVLAEFVRLGWTPKPTAKHGYKPTTGTGQTGRQKTLAKIEAILTDKGLPWGYAHGMAAKMFGKVNLRFCTDVELRKVMQALAVYQRRQNRQSRQQS